MYKRNRKEWLRLEKVKLLDQIEVIKLEHIIFHKKELLIIELI